jgi:Immunity protein 35
MEGREMVDHSAARSIIKAALASMPVCFPNDEWIILDEHTIEREWGWVFFWTSRISHESDNLRDAILGNAPYVVRRRDGAILNTGTAQPIEKYIQQFQQREQLP